MTDDASAAGGRAVAVILCAGQGSRMRADRNKVFLPLGGRPLLVWAVEAFAQTPVVDEMLLVAHPSEVQHVRETVVAYGLPRVSDVIAGGATRHQSEERALEALRPGILSGSVGVVLIHDGARPLVTAEAITALVAAARAEGSAMLGAPVTPTETLARLAPDGTVAELLPTGDLWRAQTPQAFAARELLAAYDAARDTGFEGTDTAAAYTRLGHAVAMVPGSPANLKVTTPEDLHRAEALLASRDRAPHGGGSPPAAPQDSPPPHTRHSTAASNEREK
ncbi:MAG TPA: 2-C-methyl-D-erythritol 4-phosphate cytidylyltransferase [Ktedonobacterales bacterium]